MIELNTVLVIDDDPIVHAITDQYFRERGVEHIFQAMNGAEAICRLDELGDGIDLILCDLNMPQVDGMQFLRHLMEVRFTGPVIIISGENDAIVRTARKLADSHRLNIAGTIGKPLRPSMLTPLIASAQLSSDQIRVFETPDIGYRDLQAALRLGEIQAHFQPKIDARSGRVTGAEALARWIHPQLGMISPNVFVPIAEEHRLVLPLTNVILEQSLAMAKRCWDEYRVPLSIAVNTNSEATNELLFPDVMREKVEASRIPSPQITFELTERNLLSDNAASIEVLTRLRMMGFSLSIDDFGTGTSNLEQLRNFPFTELKIDGSFVRNAETDEVSAMCLQSIVRLAKDLGLNIVAEGIETESELDLCRRLEIDELQGFHLARPLPPNAFAEFVASMMAEKQHPTALSA